MSHHHTPLVLLLLASLFVGCASHKPVVRDPHVVLIGIDGWNATCMDSADIPHIRALMDAGCWTLHKRSVIPTSSAMNWCSMFMGVGIEFHGYTTWGSATPELPSVTTNAHGIAPSFFSLLREHQPDAEIGCLYEWNTIKCFIDTLSVNHYEQADMEQPTQLCDKAVDYITTAHPTLAAVIFDQVDHVGHADGHDTPQYMARLHDVDGYVGRIVQAVTDAGLADRTIFIVTSDHGGINKGHGGVTPNEAEAPFVLAGPGILPTGEIQEPMVQYDVASTVLHLFGIPQPTSWRGRVPSVLTK